MSTRVTRRNAIVGLTGFVAVALSAPRLARATPRIVRLGHNNTQQSHYAQGAAAFAEAVQASPALASVLTIEVHGNAELRDELGMLKACSVGTLDLAICANVASGSIVRENELLNAPFLFRDVDHARAALDGAIGEEFAQIGRAAGVNVIAWGENGLRHVTSNRPIRTLSDLHGLKIRVPQSEVMQGAFRALGAEPGQLSFGLLREALRTGQFEAQENPIIVIEQAKFYNLQKFVSLTGHIYDPALFVASSDLLEDLTQAQQAALRSCARKGAAMTRQVASSAQIEGLTRLKAAGMTVVDDVQLAEFRNACRPYLEGLSATHGARLQRLMSG